MTAQRNRTRDQNINASPKRIKNIPVIIGFLTYRYDPVITNFFGGSHGASVPSPTCEKRRTVVSARKKPKAMKTIDTTRSMIFSESPMFSLKKTEEQYKRNAGTRTVVIPGRMIILVRNDFVMREHTDSNIYIQ
jgi:hypothetical protein